MSGSRTEIPEGLLAEASQWLIDLNDRPDDAQCRQQFKRWLCLSPDHQRAWEHVQTIWTTLDATAPAPAPAHEAVWKDAARAPQQKRARGLRPGRLPARRGG